MGNLTDRQLEFLGQNSAWIESRPDLDRFYSKAKLKMSDIEAKQLIILYAESIKEYLLKIIKKYDPFKMSTTCYLRLVNRFKLSDSLDLESITLTEQTEINSNNPGKIINELLKHYNIDPERILYLTEEFRDYHLFY